MGVGCGGSGLTNSCIQWKLVDRDKRPPLFMAMIASGFCGMCIGAVWPVTPPTYVVYTIGMDVIENAPTTDTWSNHIVNNKFTHFVHYLSFP